MARVTPEQFGAKWQQRLSGATEDIRRGVEGVTQAPGQRAAQQREAWLARTTAAADKWARNVSRVSLDQWKSKMLNVGLPRVAQGAQANVDKVTAFAQEFLPHLDAGVQRVRAMPKVSLEDSIQRMTAMVRHNASFKRGGGTTTGR